MRLETTTKAVTITSPFSSAQRLNCVLPGMRLMRLSVVSTLSSHPTIENPMTSHSTSVIRLSQVRIHDSGPIITRSRYTPNRTRTSAVVSCNAVSTAVVGVPSIDNAAWMMSNTMSATRNGASSTVPSSTRICHTSSRAVADLAR